MKNNHGWVSLTLVIIIVLAITLGLPLTCIIKGEAKKKAEFMSYCASKNLTSEDCRWEWERMENGQRGSIIIMPMFMGK